LKLKIKILKKEQIIPEVKFKIMTVTGWHQWEVLIELLFNQEVAPQEVVVLVKLKDQ